MSHDQPTPTAHEQQSTDYQVPQIRTKYTYLVTTKSFLYFLFLFTFTMLAAQSFDSGFYWSRILPFSYEIVYFGFFVATALIAPQRPSPIKHKWLAILIYIVSMSTFFFLLEIAEAIICFMYTFGSHIVLFSFLRIKTDTFDTVHAQAEPTILLDHDHDQSLS